MSKLSLSALAAAGLLAGGMAAGSASAADLGGDCCADLEERVAELEATTARKGNRKVSLTVSGWVAEQVLYWDDGYESNVYVTGLGTTLSSHVKFTGEAQIVPGWSAGYVLHIEVDTADPLFVNAFSDDAVNDVLAFQSYWFVKSEHLGKLSVGKISPASDNLAILVDGSGSLVSANNVLFDNASFNLRARGEYLNETWGGGLGFCNQTSLGIGNDCNGIPGNYVRYDSPTFAGFSVSADWGEDDTWDVAARYAGEWNSIKVAAAVGYSNTTDGAPDAAEILDRRMDVGYFQAGLYVQHVPTGLFVYGTYGREDFDGFEDTGVSGTGILAGLVNALGVTDAQLRGAGLNRQDESDHWYVKAGIRQKWTHLGHTVLFGFYGEHHDMMQGGLSGFSDDGVNDSFAFIADETELIQYGLGVTQEVDAAAMQFFVVWRHYEGEARGIGITDSGDVINKLDFEDMDTIKAGALISF